MQRLSQYIGEYCGSYPCGAREVDQTRLGIYLSEDSNEIEKKLVNLWIVDESFKIPADEADREAGSSYRFMRTDVSWVSRRTCTRAF